MCAALAQPFGSLSALIRGHAARRGAHAALVEGERRVTYAELDRRLDGIAASMAASGTRAGDAVAICGSNSIDYAMVMLAALRMGAVPALVPPSATPQARNAMILDSGAGLAFTDENMAVPTAGVDTPAVDYVPRPEHPFNIIYSSGTTGAPKGIVQPCSMRWVHMQRGPAYDYDEDAITLISTPLYSNTTLVSFYPALATGGSVVLMGKFDPGAFLALAERHRVTHAMLVPVQYQRLLGYEGFARHDLRAFRMKLSTSANFPAELKAQALDRWPGGLTEYYGMTEGGATCVLMAHLHRDKLHTVGKPGQGVEVRFIDETGNEVPAGETGEIVGRSGAMMTGYHNRPRETAEAEWFDRDGRRFIRTGDVGRIDADGFVTLVDRRKDMIISGGFNIYPSDLEAVLREHAGVREVAVAGVPSERWGETPVAFVVPARTLDAAALRDWANARLGKMQRLHAVELVQELPRSAIGKVLKRDLRDAYGRKGRHERHE